MKSKQVIIIGTGGHAQLLWASLQGIPNPEIDPIGWLAEPRYQGPTHLLDLPVFQEEEAQLERLQMKGIKHFLFGIGSVKANKTRWEIFERLCQSGFSPMTFVHPAATVSPFATIAQGCYVGAEAVVQPFARIGAACIVNTGAIVEHHGTIGKNTHLAPRSTLCGNVAVGDHSLIGAGATIIQGMTIGNEVTVGAGSVVIESVPDKATVAGNPAKAIVRAKAECEQVV